MDLLNNYERAVFTKDEEILPRERARYEWARSFVKTWMKVLEIGCSNGYGTRILPQEIDYDGIDYSQVIINEAIKEYGDDNHFFWRHDINDFAFREKYDVIIAFEVIEHLENGLEIIEILKKHCTTLLVTVPYREPVGFWGVHHKLHGLNEWHFPGFSKEYIDAEGTILKEPNTETFNLMIMRYSRNILASISTRWRYDTTLPMAIMSVVGQSMKPDKLVIFDDNDTPIDLRTLPTYQKIFKALDYVGIQWEVIFGERKGQHYNHEKANRMGFNFVWRLDDDTVAESNVLENLYNSFDDSVWAVGGSIIVPWDHLNVKKRGQNEIGDTVWLNMQWFPIEKMQEVDHLHCSFLYRAWIVPYNLALSRVAHTEETLFTWWLKQEWYKILVTPCITWHLRNPVGGIRDGQKEMFDRDEQIFLGNRKYGKIIVLNNWLGDHCMFRNLLDEVRKKYSHYTLACAYPEVFEGESIISIAEAQYLLGDIERFNVYRWCAENNWKDHILLAYRKMLWL